MKRKSILLVLCIGMILTSCESKISLNSTDVKNEKNQKNTTMENPDKGYNLPIDEDKKKEAVNDCEEIMGIIRDIYSEYNGIQEADQNTAEQMMNRMKEIIKQNGNPVIGSDHYSVMDNYQKMEQFLKSAEHRNTINIIKDWSKIIEQLDNSDIMKKQWERYKKDNFYAKEIKYEDLIESLKQVGKIL